MSAAATQPATSEPPRKRSFPTPFTILILVTILVWVAVFFIPSVEYQLDADGEPIAGSFQQIESPLDFGERVGELLLAPVNGLYGIQDSETGMVGPFNRGSLFGAAQAFAFIVAIGGFMTVVFATGAFELAISHLAHRFRARGTVLIVALSLLFGLLGSVMSWSDETLGFYALMLPLMLSLGYDRMVVVAVVTAAPVRRRDRVNHQPVHDGRRLGCGGGHDRRWARLAAAAVRPRDRRDDPLHGALRQPGTGRSRRVGGRDRPGRCRVRPPCPRG